MGEGRMAGKKSAPRRVRRRRVRNPPYEGEEGGGEETHPTRDDRGFRKLLLDFQNNFYIMIYKEQVQ